ncbi:MAG: MJ0042-type zinc finger domain-containing protein [Pseudomonadota bacterium]
MILTCSECQTQYRLDPDKLGARGRTVRCVDCRHTWFQAPKEEPPPMPSAAEKVEDVLKQDDAIFEAILSKVSPVTPVPPAPVAVVREEKREVVRQPYVLPVVTHDPFGVGASAFGALTFFLCVFLTLTVVFLAQRPILRHWPQMSLLYKTIGFDLNAPGEGLRLSELIAERRMDRQDRALVVEGKMTNMTEHEIDAPALHVILKNARDGVIKEWDLRPSEARLAAGNVLPVALRLTDAPEDGFSVEVRVKGE